MQGSGPPPPQNIDILNAGSGQMPWAVSTSTLSGGAWLSVFPQTGETDAASAIVPQVRVNVNPQGLSANTCTRDGAVFSFTGATNDPEFVSVVFTVLPRREATSRPIVQPAGMIFAAVAGAEPHLDPRLSQCKALPRASQFHVGRVVTGNGSNLFQTVTGLASSTVTGSQPKRIVISTRHKRALGRGIYRGTLTLSFSDGNTRAISLLLVVIGPGSGPAAPASEASFVQRHAKLLHADDAGPHLHWHHAAGSDLPAGWISGSGGSSGNRRLRQPNDVRRRHHNIHQWRPAVAPDLAEKRLVGGDLDAAGSVASVHPGHCSHRLDSRTESHGANADPGWFDDSRCAARHRSGWHRERREFCMALAPGAPGSLVAVFGSKLSQGQASATSVPLPVSTAGTTVVLGGKQVPSAVRQRRPEAERRGAMRNRSGHWLPLRAFAARAHSLSVPQPVTIAAAAPGVFTLDGKQGIVIDVDSADSQTQFGCRAHSDDRARAW